MSEFFAMGGHAAFIWPCYGLAAIVMILLVVQSLRSMRMNEKLAENLRASRSRRREKRADPPAQSHPAQSGSGQSEMEAEA